MRSKKAIKNVIYSILQQIVAIIYGLIVPRMIIQTYGSNINGIITSITQFLGYITLLEVGIGPVVKSILYKPIAQKDKNTIEKILKETEIFFHNIAYIFIGYIIVLCIVFPIIYQNDYSFVYIASLVIIISISTFFEYFFGMTYKIYLQAEQELYVVSLVKTIIKLFNIIIFVILILLDCSIHFVKLFSALVFILIPIIQNNYIKRKYNICLKNVKSSYEIKNKWDGLSQHIASVIHTNTDVSVLTFFSTPLEVSVYSIYILIINCIKEFILSIIYGFEATFGDMIAKEEKENLNEKFRIYEFLYFTIVTIIFSCTLVLIVPFVKIYTGGITDVNYNRPLFAFILVLAELFYILRLPYNNIILSAGHFKQTKKGAWIEAGVNLSLSVLFVFQFGLVGIALGTTVAMIIRTRELVFYASDNILQRNRKFIYKNFILCFFEILFIMSFLHFLPHFNIDSYISWIVSAMFVFVITCIVVLGSNFIFYKKERREVLKFIKKQKRK